jgi:hypothetical protein
VADNKAAAIVVLVAPTARMAVGRPMGGRRSGLWMMDLRAAADGGAMTRS